MKQILKKSRIEKNWSFFIKKTKIGFSVLGLRKPRNFNTKIFPFVNSHNAENCERGDPLRFFNTHSVAKFRKIEGGLFGVFKKISKKKQKIEILMAVS